MDRLSPLFQSIEIPAEFSSYENLEDKETLDRLEEWRVKSSQALTELQVLVNQQAEGGSMSLEQQAEVLAAAAPIDGDGPWITTTSQRLARGTFLYLLRLEPP